MHIGVLVQGCVHVYYVFLLLNFSGDHEVQGGGSLRRRRKREIRGEWVRERE